MCLPAVLIIHHFTSNFLKIIDKKSSKESGINLPFVKYMVDQYKIYSLAKWNIQGSLNEFPDFFVWALSLIVHTWNSGPLQSNLLWLQCVCCTITTTSGRPMEVLLCECVNDLCHSHFHLLNCLITTACDLRE